MSSTGSLPELDALRSQVADLSRQLAERDRSAHHQREQSDLLRAIVEGTAAETGHAFFSALVTHLTSVLHIKYAFIGEVQGDHIKKIRTLAVSTGGAIVDNFEYALANTPCATALTQGFACFARGLQSMFPQFQRVADLGAESYCAVPLRTKGEAIMGLLVVMDTKPWQQGDDLRSLLEVFVPRIAAEFERRRAEQERAQVLADLHNVIETIPDIVFALDPQGNVVKWNRRLGDVTGYSHAELWNKPALAFVPPEEQARTAAAIQRVFVEGYAELEGHLLTKARRLIPYHWTGALLKNTHGEPIGITGIGRDVSDKKRAEEALRKSEERYARATAVGKVGVWELDVAAGTYYGDPNLKGLFGYVGDELSTDPYMWLNLVHPDDRSIAVDHWQRIVNGETDNYHYELRMLKKDGMVIWTDVRGHAIRDPEGQVIQLLGTTVDVTERKQAQDALVQSERQIHTVLDALPMGVWFTDRSRKPLLVNPMAKQIWSNIKQIEPQTPSNQSGWWDIFGPVSEVHRRALSHTLRTGVPSQNEILDFECLDGTKKVIRNSTVPVRDEAGVVLGAIVLNEDITALRQMQEALKLTQFSVDHAVEGFFWFGPDARILNVNEAACRLLEYTRDELTAMTVYDIDPNSFPDLWSTQWDELKEKRSLTFETKYWSRTGRVLDMEVTVNYLQYEGREYTCAIMRDIGERKRAQAALCLSEARYRSLYDDTPTMYFTLATDGTVRSVNRFGAEQLGYQEEELIGHSVLGFIHEEDKETVAASLSECLATPEITRHWDFRKIRKDGTVIWVQETARVSQSSTGETVVLVTCEDITQRKRAEQESHERIRQAAAMQTALLELAHLDDISLTFSTILPHVTCIVADVLAVERVSLWLLSRDQTELVCYDLYLRSQATHSAGSRLAASRYPRYLAVLKESLVIGASNARVDQRTSEFADDYFLSLGITSVLDVPIRRQGKVIGVLWCEHVGMPREWVPEVQDFGASVGQSIARMIEASDRRRAENSLRQSEERYRSLVDNAPIGIFVVEAGRFVYANREMQRILNATRAEQLIGMPILDRIAQEFHSVVKDRIHQLMEKGQPVPSLDSQFVRLDGSRIDVAVTAIPTSFDGTDVIQVLVLDIAERKRGEQEQARLIEDLTRSQQHFQAFFNWTPSAVGISTVAEGRFINVNEGFSRLTGYTREEVIGRTTLELGLWADVSERESVLREILEQGYLHNREGLLRTKFGEIRSLMVSVESIQLGSTPCLIYLCHDITERKRMEDALRMRERELQTALQERERISQDLHDGILQSLFAVGLTLEVAKSLMPSKTLKAAGVSLNKAIDQLNRVMREIRNFIAGLDSESLEGKNLPAALKHLLESLTENQPTRVRFAVEDRAAKALSAEQSLHLLRVIQEAVSNCIRHGHAQEARVSLKLLKQGVRLRIRDDGRGFSQDTVKAGGYGLRNMAARAQRLGGRFTVISRVKEGTNIVLDLPKEVSDVSL